MTGDVTFLSSEGFLECPRCKKIPHLQSRDTCYGPLFDSWCSTKECARTPYGRGLTGEYLHLVRRDWNTLTTESIPKAGRKHGRSTAPCRLGKMERMAGESVPGDPAPKMTPNCPSCHRPPRVLAISSTPWEWSPGRGGGVNVYCAYEKCYNPDAASGVWGRSEEDALQKWAKKIASVPGKSRPTSRGAPRMARA